MADLAKLRARFFPVIPSGAFALGLLPQDASNPWMMAPFAFLALYLLLSGRLANINLRDPIFLFLLLVWLGWTWGAAFSAVQISSQVTWIILSILPMSYLAAAGRNMKPFLITVFGFLTIAAGFAISEVTILPIPAWRAELFLQDANTLGALFALAIPLGISFYFGATDRKIKILLYICLAVLLGGLIATQSRSALLAMTVGSVFVLYKNRDRFSKKFLHLGLPLIAVLGTGIFISTFGERLLGAIEGDKDVMGRWALWQSAFRMLLISPLHGVGLGIFHLYYPHYRLQADNSAGYWVHMDPLQWAVETGWGTALAFYALCGFILHRCLKNNTSQDQAAAGGALITIFLCAHTSYIFHYSPMLVITAALLTFFSSSISSLSQLRYFASIPIILTILCGFWGFTYRLPTLYMWTKAIEAYQRRDTDTYSKYMLDCIHKGNPDFPACRLQAAEQMINGSDNPNPEVVIWIKEAENAMPMAPDASALLARYHLKKYPDNPALAEADLKKALSLNPGYWPARKLLVTLLMLQDKNREAMDALLPGEDRWLEGNMFIDYYDLKKQLEDRLNK